MTPITLRRDEAVARAAVISEVRYDIELDLTVGAERFASTTVARFRCAEPGAATFMDLEAGEAGEVVRVELNGRIVTEKAWVEGRVALEDLETENEVVVVATLPYQRNGTGLHRFVDPVDEAPYLHTQFEPFDAHKVFACFDQPDLKAVTSLTVTAPGDWVCVSNSVGLPEDRDDGSARWTFAPTLPLSTYLIAVVAGPFEHVHDAHGPIELGLYCRRSLAAHLDADEMLTITKQGLDFFTERFGYPYPFGKYDQLFVPEFSAGAMENPGCITFSETYVFRSRVTEAARRSRANTTLHEMAHMWFGDLVTMRWWDDLWLNESFATYTAYLASAEATRFTDAWASFASGVKAWAYAQDQLPSTHPIAADMVDTDAVRVFFDGITYAKGASVLRQLAAWVGDQAFTQGLRAYFPRHEFGNASLADFLSALEEASGRDLSGWSEQWLETAGVNTLRTETAVAGDEYSSVVVVQTAASQHPTLRAHRLALGLYDRGEDGAVTLRERIELDVDGPRTEVPQLTGARVADLLLVNDGDLAYAKVRLDDRSVATLEASLGAVADPLARAICWGAVWDGVRDAELPARRFAGLVAQHAAAETDIGLLQTLLSQSASAIDRFADPSGREALRATLSRGARAALEAAEPGGDAQLVWGRAFADAADSTEDLTLLRALLDTDVVIEGLAVDTDVRWHLLTALAAHGDVTEADLAAELERDPTDIGARRAAAARAIAPTAEAKEAAWRSLVEDDSLPLATMRALAVGLSAPRQDEVLAPFVERYAETIAKVWSTRSAEDALLLTTALYPSSVVGHVVIEAADAALARDLPAPGARLVAESRDSTLRALRARERDAAG